MLVERASVGQDETGGGNVPDAGGGDDDGICGSVVDRRAEIAWIGKVVRARGVPGDGDAFLVEVWKACDPARACCPERRGQGKPADCQRGCES